MRTLFDPTLIDRSARRWRALQHGARVLGRIGLGAAAVVGERALDVAGSLAERGERVEQAGLQTLRQLLAAAAASASPRAAQLEAQIAALRARLAELEQGAEAAPPGEAA